MEGVEGVEGVRDTLINEAARKPPAQIAKATQKQTAMLTVRCAGLGMRPGLSGSVLSPSSCSGREGAGEGDRAGEEDRAGGLS